MTNLDTHVARRLTRFYLLALTAVALLTLAGQVLIQYALRDLRDDAHVVNVAGRQRMLSQQLTKTALLGARPPAGYPTDSVARTWPNVLTEWEQAHDGLRRGYLPGTIRVKNSPRIDRLFADVQPIFERMRGNLRRAGTDSVALGYLLRDEAAFLPLMDAIVSQYDQESQQRVARVRTIELALALSTFLVLLLEGLLIFRPAVRYTRGVVTRLLRSESELQTRNDQLRATNQSLQQTQEALLRTTEEKFQLQAAEERVRSASLLEGQEEERRRLARELHDGIGQMLTGLKLYTEKLGEVPFATDKQRRNYDELQRLLHETIDATRMVSFNLMPSVLVDFGLAAALRLLTEQTARGAGVPIAFRADEVPERLPHSLEIGLYRITQEALHNAVKHARARGITVELTQEKRTVRLCIKDDGQGFSPRTRFRANEAGGNGLANLQTRTNLLGGSLRISSAPGKGTRILATFPLRST
jgi:signal transduction histidine kinase